MPVQQNKAKITVRVYPNADRNEIVSLANGIVCIKISAPPLKGKANKKLVAFLSQLLAIPKNNINIVKGQLSRNKLIVVDGLKRESIMKLLHLKN